MNKNEIENKIKTSPYIILPLISSAAVLRKEKKLIFLLHQAIKIKIHTTKIYESLLQTYLFAGFPSALISLQIASEYLPFEKTLKINPNMYKKFGEINCKRIYGNKFDKLMNNVNGYSSDLAEWLIVEGYGKVLGRAGLSLQEREICIVAVLTSLKFRNQLYSHINGTFRLKTSIRKIRNVIECLEFCGGKNIVNYGLKVLNEFKTKKRVKE